MELSLRNALVKDEFLLHYQPVVDAVTEQVVSFEALARWHSEDHGFVSPAKFIPLAEDTRLIVPIGQWVMRQACEEAARWPGHVKININVSPEQLIEPDFAATVVRALAQTGLAPERVEIEVTESVFLRDAGVARKSARTDHGARMPGRARRFRHRLFLARLSTQAAVLDDQG